MWNVLRAYKFIFARMYGIPRIFIFSWINIEVVVSMQSTDLNVTFSR